MQPTISIKCHSWKLGHPEEYTMGKALEKEEEISDICQRSWDPTHWLSGCWKKWGYHLQERGLEFPQDYDWSLDYKDQLPWRKQSIWREDYGIVFLLNFLPSLACMACMVPSNFMFLWFYHFAFSSHPSPRWPCISQTEIDNPENKAQICTNRCKI